MTDRVRPTLGRVVHVWRDGLMGARWRAGIVVTDPPEGGPPWAYMPPLAPPLEGRVDSSVAAWAGLWPEEEWVVEEDPPRDAHAWRWPPRAGTA